MSRKSNSYANGSARNGRPLPSPQRFLTLFAIGFCLVGGVFYLAIKMRARGPSKSAEGAATNKLDVLALSGNPAGSASNAVPIEAVHAATPGLAGEEPTPEQNVVQTLSEGNELLQSGNAAAAVEKYEKALKQNPEDEDIHFNLGIALAKLGKKAEAKKHYEEALRLFPGYSEVHNNLGNLLMSENKLPEAMDHFKEALKSSPGSSSAHNNLGTALAKQGKLKDAALEFAEAIRLQPEYVEAHFNLGNIYQVQGRTPEAIREFNSALHYRSDFQPALKALMKAQQK